MKEIWKQRLLKAVRSLEIGLIHLEMPELKALSDEEVRERIHLIDDQRLFVIAEAFRRGVTIDEVHDITKSTNGSCKK